MMKRCNLLLFLSLFGLLFFGCSAPEENIQNEIFIEQHLSPDSISLNQFIYRPSDMVISDHYLIIHDKYHKNLLKIFDLDDFSSSLTFGEQGDGPDKIKYMTYNSLSQTRDGFGFVDKYLFRRFIIENNIKKEIEINEKPPVRLSYDLGIINGFCWLDDDLFIINAMPNETQHFEHVFLRGEQKVGTEFGLFPKADFNAGDIEHKQRLFSKFGLANYYKQRLFIFYYKQNLIKIYDYTGRLLNEIILDFEEILNKDPMALAFMTGTYNEDYLFLINPNKLQKEIKTYPDKNHPNILVMDWEGHLIAKLKIQEPLELIAISNDHTLYGMNYNMGDKIYKYNLKPVLGSSD